MFSLKDALGLSGDGQTGRPGDRTPGPFAHTQALYSQAFRWALVNLKRSRFHAFLGFSLQKSPVKWSEL